MQNRPRVTIAMPVYNGAQFLQEALSAIQRQTFTDFEVIITDNCSTDATPEICAKFCDADSRFRYLRNERNLGASANFNLGCELARGEYFKWCAHDDLIGPDHVGLLVAALDRDPKAALAYARTAHIDECGKPMEHSNYTPESVTGEPVDRFLRTIQRFGCPSLIFGLFRLERLRRTTLHRNYYTSDRALLAEIALLGHMHLVREAVFYCREHQSRSINIDAKIARSEWQSGQLDSFAAAEHLQLALHLWEVAGRHPQIASPWRARWALATWLARPMQLGRYAMELTAFVSPSAARWLQRMGHRAFAGTQEPSRAADATIGMARRTEGSS